MVSLPGVPTMFSKLIAPPVVNVISPEKDSAVAKFKVSVPAPPSSFVTLRSSSF